MSVLVSHIFGEGSACTDKPAVYGIAHFHWWDSLPHFTVEDFKKN